MTRTPFEERDQRQPDDQDGGPAGEAPDLDREEEAAEVPERAAAQGEPVEPPD